MYLQFLDFNTSKRNGKKNGGKKNGQGKKQSNPNITKIIKKQLKIATKGMFSAAGNELGEYFGGRLGNSQMGGNIGRKIGSQMARITGFGDYTVENNSLLKPTVVPDFGQNSVRITHKEYLGNVMGSTEFVAKSYELNPGLSDTFPWLSGIARNYQQYRINGMIFQYVSTSAFALGSTNSALGKVILATNYNSEDPDFTTTVQMLATQFSTYCRPADSIMHAIECARSEVAQNLLYVRTDLDDSSKDKRITDLGFTTVAREGMQSTSEVGGLWISYDITLMKPILNPQNAISDGFDQFVLTSQANNLFDSKITKRNNYLGGDLLLDGTTSGTYSFDTNISSGYFLNIIEFTLGPDSKIVDESLGGTYGSFLNCLLVVDEDKNGPFNGAYASPAAPQFAVSFRGITQTDSTAIIMQVIKVTGPNPKVGLTNIQIQGIGVFWRYTILPISYNTTPQLEGP